MLDTNNCDRILVETNAKMERVIQWYEDNKEWIDEIEFHSPIPSGVIEFREEEIRLGYEPDGQFVMMYLYMDNVYVCSFKYNPQTKEPFGPNFPPGLDKGRLDMAVSLLAADNTLFKCALKYHSLMSFAAHYRNVVEVAEKKRNSYTKHQAKRLSRLEHREVSLYNTIYKLPDVDAVIDGSITEPQKVKRSYTKPTAEVSVRGFYRTTKTGKRVWVKPFTKYKGKGGGERKTYKV